MPEFSKFIKFAEAVIRENWWQRIRDFSFLIGEGAFDLVVNLIIMIMVERALGAAGLGVFAYLLSILIFAGFISEFGISRYLGVLKPLLVHGPRPQPIVPVQHRVQLRIDFDFFHAFRIEQSFAEMNHGNHGAVVQKPRRQPVKVL
jgi:hypothetical protein